MRDATVDDQPSVDSLAEALSSGIGRLVVLFRTEMLERGTSLPQWRVLSRLLENGPQRITELADYEQVAQPTMTALVSRLARQGWVERLPDPTDGRACRVTLTPAGAEVVHCLRSKRRETFARYLARLGPDDHAALAAALPALQRLSQEMASGGRPNARRPVES